MDSREKNKKYFILYRFLVANVVDRHILYQEMMYMSRSINNVSSIKEVLQALIETQVCIVLVSGQKLNVEVDAVIDNLLVGSCGNRIVFIDIECICVVLTCCEEILEFVLNNMRKERPHSGESGREEEDIF